MIRRTLALGLLFVLPSCGDALLHPPAPPPGQGTLALKALVGPADEPSLSIAATFGVVDRVLVRLERSGDEELVLDETFPVAVSGGEIRLQVELELEGGTQNYRLFVEMRRGSDPLFRAETTVELGPGGAARPELVPVPVPAAVRISPPEPSPLVSLGETLQLEGEVLFVTGTVIPGLTLSWSSLDGSVVSVSNTGVVTAVGAGETRIRGAQGGFQAEVPVTVTPVPASVEVAPATLELPIGEEKQLEATVRDARGNALDLPVSWSSTSPEIAVVSEMGRVTARSRGAADVRAQSGSASGTARVTVTASPPALTSVTVTDVSHGSAVLRATARPGGLDTDLRFEVGLTPSPASLEEMGGWSVSGNDEARSVAHTISGLTPARTYYFRAVAENEEGRVESEVQPFTMLTTAPAPSNLFFGGHSQGPGSPDGEEPGVDAEGYGPALMWSFPVQEYPGYEFQVQVRRTIQPGWTTVGTTWRNSFEFDGAFDGGVHYEIRVRGCRPAVCTGWSGAIEHQESGWQPWQSIWGARIIDGNRAELRTRINDGGLPTEYFFEWGTHPFLFVSDSTPVRSVERTSYHASGIPEASGSKLESPSTHFGVELLSSLTQGTTYYFRAIARNSSGAQQSSIHNFIAGVRPQSPPDLTVTQHIYGNGHAVDWSYPAQNPDFFEIERRVGDGQWRIYDTSWGGSGFYVDWYPRSHLPHTYRVRACSRDGGCSNPSPERSIVALDRRPEAVTQAADQLQSRQARLRGEFGTGGRPGTVSFEWSVHQNMSFSVETPRVLSESGIGNLNQREWILDGLAPGRSYFYRVRVENEYGVTVGDVRSFTLPN